MQVKSGTVSDDLFRGIVHSPLAGDRRIPDSLSAMED